MEAGEMAADVSLFLGRSPAGTRAALLPAASSARL